MLKNSEDKILDILTNSRGMILDDIELIESLKISKEIGKAVNEKITSSLIKEEEISKSLQLYEKLAERGVNLFFCIQNLSRLDEMYQYSLFYFTDMFLKTIQQNECLEDRVNELIKSVTVRTFKNIARGLTNNHKFIFVFNVCVSICVKEHKTIREEELQFLMRGSIDTKVQELPLPKGFDFDIKQWIGFASLRNIDPQYM